MAIDPSDLNASAVAPDYVVATDATGKPASAGFLAADGLDAVNKKHAAATVADTASIDMTLSGQQISAAVLPAGVNHSQLSTLNTGDINHMTAVQLAALHAKQHAINNTDNHTSDIASGAIIVAAATTGLPKASVHLTENAAGVGLGPTVAAELLHLSKTISTEDVLLFLQALGNGTLVTGIGPKILFDAPYQTTVGSHTNAGAICIGKDNATSGEYGFYMAFHTRENGSALSEKTRICSDGTLQLLKGILQTGTLGQFDINPYIKLRIGRSTNNAGFQVEILRGTGEDVKNHLFKGVGDSYVCGDNGNFGIGTTAAAAKLAVNGGVHVGGDSDPGDNNLLVDGAATVSGDVYTVAWTDWAGSVVVVGVSYLSEKWIRYKRIGNRIFCEFFFEGTITCGVPYFNFNLPYSWAYGSGGPSYINAGGCHIDDSIGCAPTHEAGYVCVSGDTATIRKHSGDPFSGAGGFGVIVNGSFNYEAI